VNWKLQWLRSLYQVCLTIEITEQTVKPDTHWWQSQMLKQLSTFRRQKSTAHVERTGDNVDSVDGWATQSKLHEYWWWPRSVLRPTSTDAYCIFFSASLLVPVKIDGCLFFVTAFGIVCLDSLPFYRNDVTRSARAHEYAKCRTNRQKSRPNQRHCRRFARHCCRFVQPWQKYWFLSESKVASEFDFVASVCTGLNSTQIEGN